MVTGSEPTAVEDVDDDLERELAFYNQVCVGGVTGRGGGGRQSLGVG